MVASPVVVTGRYGTIGLVHYVEVPFWPLNTTLYVQDFKGNDPLFIYYLLKTISYRDYLDKAAVPGINRNDVHKARVRLPPKVQQQSIAGVMRCLDTGITQLEESSATLEMLARAIFKSWFVDFDPVRAKVEGREPEGMDAATAALFPAHLQESSLGFLPEGWKTERFGEFASVTKGKSYKSSDLVGEHTTALVTLKSFDRGGGFNTNGFKPYSGSYKECQVLRDGDLIVAYTDVTQAGEVIGRPAVVTAMPPYEKLVASCDVGVIRPLPNPDVPLSFLLGILQTARLRRM